MEINEIREIITDIFDKEAGRLEFSRGFIWETPLVACADAEDRLFNELKRVVSQDHLMPSDLLPDAQSVIVYFIPFKPEVSKSNIENFPFASRMWAEAYVVTNTLIGAINQEFSRFLASNGYKAAVTPATHNFDEVRLISRWSHKHIAYIAGLGTFGLHHLLITEKGCCGRLGSLVTTASVKPTPRPSIEYCLEKSGQRCSKCLNRCPVGALQDDNFNRHLCYDQLLKNDHIYKELPLTDVCGHCSCGVPCSHGLPVT